MIFIHIYKSLSVIFDWSKKIDQFSMLKIHMRGSFYLKMSVTEFCSGRQSFVNLLQKLKEL